MSENGIVKWYNDSKGYGFVLTDSGESILAKAIDIIDARYLIEFQRVEFDRVEEQAVNIRVIASANGTNEYIDTSTPTHILHDTPRVVVYEDVIPLAFCDEIIKYYSQDRMNPNAGYVSAEQAYGQVTSLVENRGISKGMLPRHVDYIADMIHNTLKLPYSHIEAIDVYNYQTGQYLDLHHDYPYDPKKINYYKLGGDRVGTAIFWFNDDFEGGETYFPKLGVTVTPKRGGLLYFKQCYDEATNWDTIHEGKKITQGTKWISSCFFGDSPKVKS
jgi:prolyl 4-hydroxylase